MRKIVILTDARSVVSALKSHKSSEANELRPALNTLVNAFQKVVLQWVPSHCNIDGNEAADKLASEGGRLPQTDCQTSYEEAKTATKLHYRQKWHTDHKKFIANDSYHQLSRSDQVCILRLRTGHNRLGYHMFTKFGIGTTSMCPCGYADLTERHVLQGCALLSDLRNKFWPDPVAISEKLYGGVESLKNTAQFIRESGISV